MRALTRLGQKDEPAIGYRLSVWILFLIPGSELSSAEEIRLTDEQLAMRARLGVVVLSADNKVELKIPLGFMDDKIQGQVLLVNDSKAPATIANVKTSCGCTSAVPVEELIQAGGRNILLVDYRPKSAGKSRLEALITFGEKEFHLSGIAETMPRMALVSTTMEFGKNDRANIVIKKFAPTRIDRLIVSPASIKVENFVDGDESVSATLVRAPDRFHDHVSVSPALGDRSYAGLNLTVHYKGMVDALPRRIIATGKTLRFYLRGDVEPLVKADEMSISFDGQTLCVPCKVTPQNGVLKVLIEDVFEPGEHMLSVQMNDFSFPLTIIKR
ncbi:hypothetical protein Pla22_34320 [Rubripirellula amarantea]|uniref:DUF1573 domain-containing protein n=1 Tax=Rubripirellula amarantea TaxID=2527999 RepID=A0A5C5WKR4_9BACT|nr:DUF1573 domain-containing protein [Rubripirellula amarantea]TWT50689.1 hypothetical protein Pla22_34320 [Rubripirellula amarantea]